MPHNSPNRLIIFTRYPEPGRTKTRLIPVLGPDRAADLQRRMTEETVASARQAAQSCSATLELRYQGGNELLMTRWLGENLPFREQGPGNLGEKMDRAFRAAFADSCTKVLVIGTDIPRLSPAIMAEAFEALDRSDLVLGPARDGGYYLIGLKSPCPELFRGHAWGGRQVLSGTMAAAAGQGLAVHLLEELCDVDRPEDLADIDNHTHPQ